MAKRLHLTQEVKRKPREWTLEEAQKLLEQCESKEFWSFNFDRPFGIQGRLMRAILYLWEVLPPARPSKARVKEVQKLYKEMLDMLEWVSSAPATTSTFEKRVGVLTSAWMLRVLGIALRGCNTSD